MENLHGKKIQIKMLIKFVKQCLMRSKRLREEIAHDNDELLSILKQYKEEGPTNLTWAEGNRWYGWTYNKSKSRYYFDDIGNESLMGLWEDQWVKEEAEVE